MSPIGLLTIVLNNHVLHHSRHHLGSLEPKVIEIKTIGGI